MEDNQRCFCQRRFDSKSIMKMYIYVVIASYGTLAASSDDRSVRLAVTAQSFLVLTSERTSNAIPEAEVDSLDTLKNHSSKKQDSSILDQLEKPYPYLKSEGHATYDETSETVIQQLKPSDRPVVPENDSGPVSVYISPGTEAELTTEPENESTIDSILDTTTESLFTSASESHCKTGRCSEIIARQTFDQSSERTTLETELQRQSSTSTSEPITGTTVDTMYGTTTKVITSLIVKKTNETIIRSTVGTNPGNSDENIKGNSTRNPIRIITKISNKMANVKSPVESTRGITTENTVVTTFSVETRNNATIQNTQSTINLSLHINKDKFRISNEASNVVKVTTTKNNDILPISTELTTNQDEHSSKFFDEGQLTTMPIIAVRKAPTAITATTLSTTKVMKATEIPSTTATTTTTMSTTSVPTTTSIVTSATTVSTTTTITNSSIVPSAKTTSSLENINTWKNQSLDVTTYTIDPSVPVEDLPLIIKIVIRGSLQEVCARSLLLRQSLANLVNTNNQKTMVSSGQIVLHLLQCSDLSTSSTISETTSTSVLVYIVDPNGNFDEELTKILPKLYKMRPINFPLMIDSFALIQKIESGNTIAIITVSSVVFICLILLAGLLFLMKKRQGRFNYGERCRPVSLDAYSLDSVSAYNSVRRNKGVLRSSKRSYGNPTFEDSSATPSHPLNFAGLSSFCNDNNGISEEFASIPQVSSNIDELPPGAELKNRYANVIPLPETRVPLQKMNNDPLTEYINASFIRGPKNANKYYIGCQAPTENTVSDFWRMIWEQQCKVIIMLTDLVENGVEKCTEYIPPLEISDCHRLFGDYQVTLKKREAKEKYAISTLHLKNLENSTFREISHIWYLWPTNGAPTDGSGLISILLEARALQRGAAGPIVVHCSPGTGRTGTLIALDLGIRQYEITRTVDVPRVVYTIRRDRAGAVQTREQYIFIYKALNLYAGKLAGGAIESA